MRSTSPTSTSLGLDDPLLRDRNGTGVTVAILDSGLHPGHPHLRVSPGEPGTAGELHGLTVGGDGGDAVDRLGHGTAVAAAVREKAPGAPLHAVKIFHDTLSTDTPTLVRALDRAADLQPGLINLSLGTADEERREALRAPVARLLEGGAMVVSAREHRGRRWWPGSLPGVVGVLLDWDCPRDEVRLVRDPDGRPVFRASGYPRPVPGVPPSRNLKGISFAVANTTGILARLLEARPGLRSAGAIARYVEDRER